MTMRNGSARADWGRSLMAGVSTLGLLAATPALAQESDDPESDEESRPHHEHDSDRCHTCQNFHASRHAAIIVGDSVFELAQTIELAPRPQDPCRYGSTLFSSVTVRGPPTTV